MEAGVKSELVGRQPVRRRLIKLLRRVLRDRHSLAVHVAKHPKPPTELVRLFRRVDSRVDRLLCLCVEHSVAAYTDSEICLLMTDGELTRLERLLGAEEGF